MPENKILFYESGKNLLTILREGGIFVESSCGGGGTCGKCKVTLIVQDQEGRAHSAQSDLIAPHETPSMKNPLRAESSERRLERLQMTLLSEESESEEPESEEEDFLSKEEDLSSASGNELRRPCPKEKTARVCLACVFFPSGNLTVKVPPKRQKDELFVPSRFSAKPRRTERKKARRRTPLGLALDVGTTTLEVVLVDRETEEELANRSAVNPQVQYGMDILSRISHVMRYPKEVRAMQRVLLEKVNAITEDLCREAQVYSSSIDTVAVAANCTMLHFLLGISPTSLGTFPFTPVFLESRELPVHEIGLTALRRNARLFCLPSVSAFIGADIVAGVYATGLVRKKGNVLFLDIGTNGEMVLSRQGTLVSCSCAAGPALEGMNISCGMRAEPGAVEDVSIDYRIDDRGDYRGAVQFQVIGGEPPVGICGSGILAVIRELLRVGLLRRDGSLLTEAEVKAELPSAREALTALCREENGIPAVCLFGDIVVTQKDVRQVQLAKGALLSGLLALLNQAGLSVEDIDKVLIAGQFGAHLSVESLMGCGILPHEPSFAAEKVEYVGNTSKKGALMALTSSSALAEMSTLAQSIAYVELGATPRYEELFMRCLEFP
jgi:uncharacterized 2Fe-2S/4Fe-4S cluster protein (DUF4445 family)